MTNTPPRNRPDPLSSQETGTSHSLGEGQPLHQQLVEGAADWLWQCNGDYVLEYNNPWVEKLLGYNPGRLRGRSLFDLMHPDDVAQTRTLLESHRLRHQPLLQLRCRFVHSNGDILLLETNVMPFSERFQLTQGFHGASRLVPQNTADNAATNAYESLMESLALVNTDLVLTYANQAFCDLFGYAREDAIGLPIQRLSLDESYSRNQPHAIAELLRHQNSWQGQVKRKTREGHYIPVLLSVRKRFDGRGHFVGYLATYLDLRHLRHTELKLKKGLNDTIRALAQAIEYRDAFQQNHQRRVADLAVQIALDLGKDLEFIEGLELAALLHDIGKIYLPAEITLRAGPLQPQEIQLIQTHPLVGYQILKDADLPWPVAEIVLQHHERYDGSGYPNRLKGDQILMGARILAVADSMISLASPKPYRPAHDRTYCILELQRNRGVLYDPEITDICLAQLQRHHYPIEELSGPHAGPAQFHTEDA